MSTRDRQLAADSDMLSAAGIEKHLATRGVYAVEVRREVDSTNTWARERALAGAPEGTVLVAEGQTAGRGRRGHAFFSPQGSGIYLSVLLRPALDAQQSHLLTCAAAVAGARAIEQVAGREALIKWVNDIYCDGRKVSGILTEGAYSLEEGRFDWAVVGIGINVKPPREGFPDDIASKAGALLPHDGPAVRCRLVASFLDEFWQLYERLPADTFHDEYRRRSLLLGREVQADLEGQLVRGTAVDIDGDYRLIVDTGDGQQRALSFGETSVTL